MDVGCGVVVGGAVRDVVGGEVEGVRGGDTVEGVTGGATVEGVTGGATVDGVVGDTAVVVGVTVTHKIVLNSVKLHRDIIRLYNTV